MLRTLLNFLINLQCAKSETCLESHECLETFISSVDIIYTVDVYTYLIAEYIDMKGFKRVKTKKTAKEGQREERPVPYMATEGFFSC